MDDALVIGAGPAGLAIASELCNAGLRVAGLAPVAAAIPWRNTYGIWRDELEPLGLTGMLGHSWHDSTVYVEEREIALNRTYGLFDNPRLQGLLLARCEQGGMHWHAGIAATADHHSDHTRVTTRHGEILAARVVIDASGHTPALLSRPPAPQIAYQAAYGIVGAFSRPPVREGQLVLMDYRSHHLPPAERADPPTFLYAMGLGNGRYFVEETSLAHTPAVPLDLLERRLYQRLAAMDIQILEIQHVERCLFPMNAPLPDLNQPLAGYGGAAAMVHPASGYQVGAALRYAPLVARALAGVLGSSGTIPRQAVQAAWQALWPAPRLRRRHLYLFGLAGLLQMNTIQLQCFFGTFFRLPYAEWSAYLSDTHTTASLLKTMLRLFGMLPWHMRKILIATAIQERNLLYRTLQ